MKHDETHEDNWEEKENEWLPFLKNDVLSTTSYYARYAMGMEVLTNFGMKNSLTLPSLANKYFNSLRDENDEPIYAHTDPLMRNFVSQSIKGARCSALNQYYRSSFSDNVFNIITQELNVQSNICEIMEKNFEFTNKHRKTIENENDSQFKGY